MPQHRVCPWWLGYFLASPIRRIFYNPARIVAPYVHSGMTVLEPGPGMGFFTIELARLVGDSGRVVAVDIQPKMLEALERRLAKAGLSNRVEARLAQAQSMGLADLAGAVDFVFAAAVVHEMPSAESFFHEASQCMKSGASLPLVEPAGHVTDSEFGNELDLAARAGLRLTGRPETRRSHAALLQKN